MCPSILLHSRDSSKFPQADVMSLSTSPSGPQRNGELVRGGARPRKVTGVVELGVARIVDGRIHREDPGQHAGAGPRLETAIDRRAVRGDVASGVLPERS